MSNSGVVLCPETGDAWFRLINALDRRPARYSLRDDARDARRFVVLYGRDVNVALDVYGVRVTGLHPHNVTLVDVDGMADRARLDRLAGGVPTDPGTASCPLCGRIARLYRGRLVEHEGRELAAEEWRVRACRASQHTQADAGEMARREEAELVSLRLRAHP